MANSDFYFFQNCRGLNYYPIRDDLYKSSMLETFPYGAYQGVWGGYTNWKWFDYETVDQQLSWMKRIGINCVRLHTSFYAWLNEKQGQGLPFFDNLQSFASLCNKYNIFVLYTLWDGFNPIEQSSNATGFPKYDTDYTTTAWTEPGYYQVSSPTAAENFYIASGQEYVRTVVSAVSGFQSTLAYDVMNEPDFQTLDQTHPPYLSAVSAMAVSSAELIKEINPLCRVGAIPRQYTMLGNAQIHPNHWIQYSTRNKSHAIQDSSAIDVLSIHPYTVLRMTKAHWMTLAVSGASDLGKVFFMTEGGSPGNYDLFSDEVKGTSPFRHIGQVLWNAIVGEPLSRDAFKYTNGLFHSDGTCRLISEVSALASWAMSSGEYLPWQLNPNFEVKTQSTYQGVDGGYSNYLPSLGFSFTEANVTGTQNTALNYAPIVGVDGCGPSFWFEEGMDLIGEEGLLAYMNTFQSLTNLSAIAASSTNEAIKEYYVRRKRINTVFSDMTFLMDITIGLSGTPAQRNLILADTQLSIWDAYNNNITGGSPGTLAGYAHNPSLSEWNDLDVGLKNWAEQLMTAVNYIEETYADPNSEWGYTFPVI